MKFSVVITTYNRLKLLQRAINSVLQQTMDCEIVVVDDCSIDGTRQFVETLCDEMYAREDFRLIYYRNSENSGHAATVNIGVEKSSGDWIKFLDDDDYLAPNCLEEMSKAITLNENAAICSCVAAQVDQDGVEKSRTPQLGPGKAYYIPQADIHYGMLLEIIPFGTPVQVACRRQAFLESGGWDISMTSCDDIDSWIRISKFGDAIFLNQCLAYRTQWDGGYDQKIAYLKRLDTNILMKEKIYALVDATHSQKIPKLENIRSYLKLHWMLVALKNKNIRTVVKIFEPAILSQSACWLLISALLIRRWRHQNTQIRKFILIHS
ncbi:glycosyltransferase family 2 protein [Dulcicalothrix desertica]|nr:glycosyltransferase family 2 protein [Dulcicalothrix desertica]TWH40550.1 Glycosyltransferases involved in cell wall biogenesis [Dulcicalothrix desertica PCC 7102]